MFLAPTHEILNWLSLIQKKDREESGDHLHSLRKDLCLGEALSLQ